MGAGEHGTRIAASSCKVSLARNVVANINRRQFLGLHSSRLEVSSNGSFLFLVKNRLQLRRVRNDPALDAALVDVKPTLLHYLLDVSIAEGIRQVPADTLQYHFLFKIASIEADHTTHQKGSAFDAQGIRVAAAVRFATEPFLLSSSSFERARCRYNKSCSKRPLNTGPLVHAE